MWLLVWNRGFEKLGKLGKINEGILLELIELVVRKSKQLELA